MYHKKFKGKGNFFDEPIPQKVKDKKTKKASEETKVVPKKARVSLKSLMFRDTFRSYIPLSLRVMRG